MAEATERSLAVHYPWQQSQWQHIDHLLEANRLPHALLLSGVKGIGKMRFAKALAQRLLCEAKTGIACGQCRQCQLNLADTHPDMKLLQPEDGGRQIKVDQVRSMVHFLDQTAQQGGAKVAILAPAEAMNSNAANALLKSLEEPGANTLLILVTDRPSALLATIRSRCQMLSFVEPEPAQALAWLGALLPDADAATLLKQSRGRPLMALQLHESGQFSILHEHEQALQQLLAGKLSPLKLAERWQEQDMDELLSWLQLMLVDLLKSHQAGLPQAEAWQAILPRLQLQPLYRLLDGVNMAVSKLRQGNNPNKQLLLEDLLIRLQAVSK